MEPKTLYHYCSVPTGMSILQARTIKLSALSKANDALEGRVLGKTFAKMLRETELPESSAELASFFVEGYPDATEGFAFCLSEKGDLLSQWRAYGNDGTGFAIGFSSKELTHDFGKVNFGSEFFELIKVQYGEAGMAELLQPVVKDVVDNFSKYGQFARLKPGISKEEALNIFSDRNSSTSGLIVGSGTDSEELVKQLLATLAELHFQIYSTKPHSFHEECEWRIIRYRHKEAFPEIEYTHDNFSIKPFISCLIADPAKQAIQELILGPKNTSNIDWVRAFLASLGLAHIDVRKSSIESYR
jgi:hypothetical protein